jgi:hypothetical protein
LTSQIQHPWSARNGSRTTTKAQPLQRMHMYSIAQRPHFNATPLQCTVQGHTLQHIRLCIRSGGSSTLSCSMSAVFMYAYFKYWINNTNSSRLYVHTYDYYIFNFLQ